MAEAGMKMPEIGDVVLWMGFAGPQHVLIADKYETAYKVIHLAGKPVTDDCWTLNEHNAISWRIVI